MASSGAKQLRFGPFISNLRGGGVALMAIHKRILEWQAAHPNITWIGWGIVWAIVLAILLWPRKSG
jgi:hypothetical protein